MAASLTVWGVKHCINCGEAIPKKTHGVRFEKPQEYRPATTKTMMGREFPEFAERPSKPEGHRDVDSHGNSVIYTDNPPKTKADCQRFVNGLIVSVKRHWKDRHTIHEFTYWDGETYLDPFFDKGRCAQEFGYKAARAGVTF
jgi:hypothetical protein